MRLTHQVCSISKVKLAIANLFFGSLTANLKKNEFKLLNSYWTKGKLIYLYFYRK